MSKKNAPSSAMAKPCRKVEIDLEVIADLQDTLSNVSRLLDEELAVRVGSISCNGKLIGLDDDEMVGVHAVAEVAAARLAVDDAIAELGEIALGAVETAIGDVDDAVSAILDRDEDLIRIGRHVYHVRLVHPAPGENPEAECFIRMKKKDAARAKVAK